MKSIKFALVALTAGIIAAGAGTAQAMPAAKAAGASHPHASGIVQVRHGGYHHRGSYGPRMHNRHHGFRHFRQWGYSPRITIYGGGGGCYWLKERARETGSRYWWRRYQACRHGW